ncbi:MAG: hypothetical protein LUQ03_05875, partial [Methanomicrobiales archaeon]|nr:hypothetical protein [Methanomicrobiales archaeon]
PEGLHAPQAFQACAFPLDYLSTGDDAGTIIDRIDLKDSPPAASPDEEDVPGCRRFLRFVVID